MKPPLLAAALIFASVSLYGAAAGGGTVPTTPTTPSTKTGCNKPSVVKPSTPKAPEKKEDEKKCDDSKRPFKK